MTDAKQTQFSPNTPFVASEDGTDRVFVLTPEFSAIRTNGAWSDGIITPEELSEGWSRVAPEEALSLTNEVVKAISDGQVTAAEVTFPAIMPDIPHKDD